MVLPSKPTRPRRTAASRRNRWQDSLGAMSATCDDAPAQRRWAGMRWSLHWLEATGDLGPWKDAITAEMEATWRHLAASLTPSRLDILLQHLSGAEFPEIGRVGHAYRPGLFALTLDRDNPNFEASLGDGTLRRQVAHKVHHGMRMPRCDMAGPWPMPWSAKGLQDGCAGRRRRRREAPAPRELVALRPGALRRQVPES